MPNSPPRPTWMRSPATTSDVPKSSSSKCSKRSSFPGPRDTVTYHTDYVCPLAHRNSRLPPEKSRLGTHAVSPQVNKSGPPSRNPLSTPFRTVAAEVADLTVPRSSQLTLQCPQGHLLLSNRPEPGSSGGRVHVAGTKQAGSLPQRGRQCAQPGVCCQ